VPVDGVAMLPVTMGAGLMPGEGSSVAPRPIPTGEIDDPVPLPSGEVVPIVGVGRAIPVTCASAPPPAKKARQAATRQYLTGVLHGRRSGYTEHVDGRTPFLAVLHDHRVNRSSTAAISIGTRRSGSIRLVRTPARARWPTANAQACFAKLASTLSSVIG